MFSNFAKAFKKNERDVEVPKEIIESLSEKLPDGFEYMYIGEGACGIIPSSPIFNISIGIELPNGFKPSNAKELMEFMYRTQKELTCVPDEDGCITINDIKIKLADCVKFPFEDGDFISSKFVLKPMPFEVFEIPLESDGFEQKILMQRQPHADANKSLFKNVDDNILRISYLLDERKRTLKFSLKINIEKSNDVGEILKNVKLYQSFLKAQVKFAGIDLSSFLDKKEDGAILETIIFWEKIAHLEKVLLKKFTITFPITKDDGILIEKLYKSFVQKKPYKEYIDINSLTTTATQVVDWEGARNEIGVAFQFLQYEELNIWGTTIDTYNTTGLFDLRVTDAIEKDHDKLQFELIIEPISERRIYMSSRYFLDEEEANKYIQSIEELQNAELLTLDGPL